MRLLGVDFGTSNTAAVVGTPDGRTRPLLFDGSPLLPSAVYLDPGGRLLVGRDAERSSRLDPGRFEPNPKRRIDEGTLLLGGQAVPVARLVAAVLAHVFTEARRSLGAAPEQVRLTHPERWGEQRRAVLLEAARMAGLGTLRLIAEPVAAASYYTAVLGSALPVGRALAIYDLGGGTFDAAVVRRTPAGFEVLAEAGIPDLGGLDFDQAVVEHLGRAYGAGHPAQWARLTAPADANDRRDRRLLYDDVRGAKEMLSRTASTDVHLPSLRTDVHLTRAELEELIKPYLEHTLACLRQTIAAARLAPADLAGIFLVGGSSRIPLAAHLIHSGLGVAPTVLEQPETVVVEGALYLDRPAPVAGRPGAPRVVPQPQPHPPPPGRAVAQAVRPGPPVPAPRQPQQPAPLPPRQAGPIPQRAAGPPPPGSVGPVPPGPVRPRVSGPVPATGPRRIEPILVTTLVVLGLVVAAFVVLLAVLV
jgi:molecular chaperone DnaK (HSP70)